MFDLLVVDRGEALKGFFQLGSDPRLDTIHSLADLSSKGGRTPPNFAADHLTYGFQAELLLLRHPPFFSAAVGLQALSSWRLPFPPHIGKDCDVRLPATITNR